MKGLDYYDLPDVLNSYTGNVLDLAVSVEKKLLEKAKFINKKMGSADVSTLSRLKDEQNFIIEVATMLDRMKQLIELTHKTVTETNADFWDHAHKGGELKEEIRLHKETIQILYAQRDLPWAVIDKMRNGTDWVEADKRINDIKKFLKK